MYTEIFLRLEPLGLELVASALRHDGHEVRLIDLQADSHAYLFRELARFAPDAICFGMNYLANIPEVVDLAIAVKEKLPSSFVFVGGHSASFTAAELLEHAQGAIDCVIRGEGEDVARQLLSAVASDRNNLHHVPGVMTTRGEGPRPKLIDNLDDLLPARDLLRNRRKYFIGVLEPCASIEFTRGCPWDCSFCSAWTFYGRSYRKRDPEKIGDEIAGIREPGIFIVDDVAFIHPEHGFAIGHAIEKRGIRKQYYLETRGDVLLKNMDVFRYWRKLGLEYMFLGLEAIDEEGLKKFRKRISLGRNFEALEAARSLGIMVAINIIADPDWDAARFAAVRDWAMSVPEIVNVSVNTPYPGTESFMTDGRKLTTRDYRLFDIQHCVLPTTRLPLEEFYRELVKTQQVLNMKHLGLRALKDTALIATKLLLRGQTNFVKMLWKFNSVYNHNRQLADHQREVKYQMRPPVHVPDPKKVASERLYIIQPSAHAAHSAAQHEQTQHAPA
jgi:hopanoid C-3 methylase HpnR